MKMGWSDHLVLGRPPLSLVSLSVLDKVLVGVALEPGLVTTLCRCAPDRDGVDVTLGFTSSTTVRMVGCKFVSLEIVDGRDTRYTHMRSWQDL